jgi:hypothetical protein
VVPSQVTASPPTSTATQNVAEVQDTAVRTAPLASIATGPDQVAPFQVTAVSEKLTATQKDVVGHETDAGPLPPDGSDSIASGVDHVEPFHVTARPSESTATQKEAVAHDTEVTPK